MIAAYSENFSLVECNQVREKCRSYLLSANPISYPALLQALGGTSPDIVIAALEDIETLPHVKDILRQAKTPVVHPQSQGPLLPLPHPGDAEWRFDSRTVDLLLDEALAVTADGDSILFFGTPGVAVGARNRTDDRLFSVISPANVIETSLIAATRTDLRFSFGRVASRSCQAVFMDPPWYLPAYEQMLATAAPFCKQGAYLYLSLPGEGTRPSAADDNEAVVKLAETVGFELIERRVGALRYTSPLFEISAFAARGVFAPTGWRRGNLYVFRLNGSNSHQLIPTATNRSFELTISGCRIRLALGQTALQTDGLHPIVSSEVFPSVSSRDPIRKKANLWTTTNRAYSLDPTKGLMAMAQVAKNHSVLLPERLDAQIARVQPKGVVDKIQPLIQKLEDLVAIEINDSQRLTQGANGWLKSANDARFLND